jgi:hypothetical protein
MTADVLVNTRLQQYGFDLRDDYEREMAETKRQLGKISTPPANRFDRMIWMVNYVSKILDWELIFAGNVDNEFKVWFTSKYPDIAVRGTKLLEMVNRIGYETPEKQKKLFREIIRRYKLEGIIFL